MMGDHFLQPVAQLRIMARCACHRGGCLKVGSQPEPPHKPPWDKRSHQGAQRPQGTLTHAEERKAMADQLEDVRKQG